MPIYSYFPQLFQSITYSRQTTRKLSLSTQLSSEALIAHPTPGAPLNLTLIQPPKQPHSPTALILSPEQPHSPTALKSQPVRRVLPVDGLCRRGADSRQPRSQPPTKPQPEPMHTPRLVIQGGRVGWLSRLGVQVGRFRVAARGLDEASALRWMPGWKG